MTRPTNISITWDNEKIRLTLDEDGWYVPRDEEWYGHSCKVDHEFELEELIKYLEKNHDEWSNQEDWWGGTDKYDVNVYTDDFFTDDDYGHVFQISVYGLELMQGLLQSDTDTVIDEFTIYL